LCETTFRLVNLDRGVLTYQSWIGLLCFDLSILDWIVVSWLIYL